MRLPLLLCLLAAIPAWAEEIRLPAQIRMPLWSASAPDGRGGVDASAKPMVTFHRAPEPDGTVIVVCPGGGYGGLVTDAEGHGIARWLNGHGISAVVLEYRLPAGRSEVPLLDAKRAIRLARHHAAEWGVKTNRVGIVGFSAGGHLAATAAQRQHCHAHFVLLTFWFFFEGEVEAHGLIGVLRLLLLLLLIRFLIGLVVAALGVVVDEGDVGGDVGPRGGGRTGRRQLLMVT